MQRNKVDKREKRENDLLVVTSVSAKEVLLGTTEVLQNEQM